MSLSATLTPGLRFKVIPVPLINAANLQSISMDTKRQLMALATNSESQMDTIRTLNANVEGLQDTISTLSSSSPELLEQIRAILQLPQAAREAAAQQLILGHIDSDQSQLRYEVVDKAHQDTFRWIIEDGADVNSKRLIESRKLLRTWLSKEQGVFHLAGKLGSGKSTLMKFLFNHPNTTSDLRRWAGKAPLGYLSYE